MRRTGVLALVGIACACAGEAAEPAAHAGRDSAGVRIVVSTRAEFGVSPAWLVDPEPMLDLTRPVAGTPHVFYRVSDLTMLPDSSIIVAEMGSGLLRRFSWAGELLAESGGEGDGPGEYRQLVRIHQYRSDSIVAFDRWLGRATVLDPELEVARTIQFPAPYAGNLAVLNDGTFVVQFSFPSVMEYDGNGGIHRTPLPVLRYSAEGKVRDTLLVLPGNEELMIRDRFGGWASSRLLFPRLSFMAASGNEIFAATSDSMSFDILSPDGLLLRRVEVPTWDQSISREMIEGEKYAFVPEDASPDVLRRVEERFELQPVPKSRPAFEALLVDERGYAWVAKTKGRSNYYEATRWEVFAPTGEWLGAVVTPARFIVHEIGAEYVLGVWLDDLDVEHVQVLRVVRNRPPA